MKGLSNGFLYFRLGIEQYIGHLYEMRTMFDTSEGFSEYCKKNILSSCFIRQNKRFDKEHLGMDRKVLMLVNGQGGYDIASELKQYYPDIEKGIYLFGAGTYGELASLYLIKRGIVVRGIIDNNQKKQGGLCNEIPIISLRQIEFDCQNVLITVADKKIIEEMKKQVLGIYPNAVILMFTDLVEYLEEKYSFL